MGGKTLLSVRGSAIVRPLAMLARDDMIARSTTLLPAVRAVMTRASRIGTPEDTRVPRVRLKRATADFRISAPNTGTRRRKRSIQKWPSSVRYAYRMATAATIGTAIRYQTCSIVKLERLMTNCVGAGSRCPKLEKTSAKTGITQMSRTAVTRTAAATMHEGEVK